MPKPGEPERPTLESCTLRDLVEHRVALVFEFANCRKIAEVDVLELVGRFGPDSRIEPIRFKARCTRCGRRRARPLLRFPWERGDWAWWPWPPGACR